MSLATALIQYARSGGSNVSPVLEALADSRRARAVSEARPNPHGQGDNGGGRGPSLPLERAGKTIVLPTSWRGTHVTSGLGWGTRTASDIMGSPGTPVGAPETGVVEYWKPQGAQGGGSMLIRTPGGAHYWLGHLAQGVPAGTRVRRGQRIASISPEHAAPHVHIDKR